MSLLNLLSDNGSPVIAILLGLSIIACAIILIKLVQLIHLNVVTRGHSDQALTDWHNGNEGKALDRLEKSHHPVDQVVHVAMTGDHSADKVELLREEIQRIANLELNRLRVLLRPLELIAGISPLLGLLGTVLGMIEAFQQLSNAGDQVNPALLSAGIWQALLTTAIGLSIAIPVVVIHSFLERQVEKARRQIEDQVTQVFTRDVMIPKANPASQAYARQAIGHAA